MTARKPIPEWTSPADIAHMLQSLYDRIDRLEERLLKLEKERQHED